jgi:hypothetical protein
VTDLVMTYTVNPVWAALKRLFKGIVASQEAAGRARAAHHLANMGYYKEAKDLMLKVDKD